MVRNTNVRNVCNFTAGDQYRGIKNCNPKASYGIGAQTFEDCPLINRDLKFLHKNFINAILAQLRNDSISEEIKKDAEILYIGNQTFKELKNKETNQSSLKIRSRRIMKTFIILKKKLIYKKKTTNKPLNFSATLQLKYWPIYQETIQKLIYSKKNEEVYFKRGTAINLRHCLSLGIQRMKFFYRRYKTSEDPENAKIIVKILLNLKMSLKTQKQLILDR